MSRLFGYLRRYRTRYAAGGACLLITASLAMSIPYLLKRAVDAIEQGGPMSRVGHLALAIVAVAAVQGVVRTLSRALIFNVGRDVEYDLRNDLFAHLLRLPPAYYQEQHTGDLMSRLVNDVMAVRLLLGPGILNLVNTPIYFIYAVSIMASLSPGLTIVSLLPFPLLLLAVKRITRKLMEQMLAVQEGLAGLSTAAQERVSGMHVVRAYGAEDAGAEAFGRLNRAFLDHSIDMARYRGRLLPLMKVAAGTGTLMVLTGGGLQVINGTMGLGDLVAFLGYLNLLAWPTMALGWMLAILQRGRVALQRLEQIFTVVPAIRDAPGAAAPQRMVGAVEFRDVSFTYPRAANGKSTLDAVSLRVAAGQKLAIVGRTGAGKSSLVQLLPRLFDPQSGAVLLDGRDVRDLPLAVLRRAVAFVPQDPFLFSTTIRRNIAFALDEADEEQIRTAAEIAGVAADIEAFPNGYDTVIGERGVTLSGGQKQRLTLARAVAADAPVLVLDDALSSVDTRTEGRILRRLGDAAASRTRVVIAHRVSTVLDADCIAVLDGGRIVEVGDHEELMARNGLYADIFRRQQLEEEIEEL